MPLVAVWVVALVLFLWLQRDLTFVVDEGDWITFAGTNSASSFVEPFNGHLILLPLLIFRLLLDLFGTSYVSFTLTEIACLFSLSLGLFVFAKPRIGSTLALLPASIPLFLGAGWPLLLAPLIGIEWTLSLSLGLWALILTSRGSLGADFASCLLLAMSLATFSVSLSFLVACGALILLVRKEPSRLWVPIIPFLSYLFWTLSLNQSGASIDLSNLLWLPPYLVDSATAATSALLGQQLPYGPGTSLKLEGFSHERLLLFLGEVGLLLGFFLALIRSYRKRGYAWSPLIVVLAVPIVLFSLQGLQLEELRRPIEARYLPAAVVTLSLPLVELCRGVRPSRTVLTAALTVGLLLALLGIEAFREGRAALVAYTNEARATILALDIAGNNADATYTPSSEQITDQSPFMFFQTSRLQDFVRTYGSPGFSESQLLSTPQTTREVTDLQLGRVLKLRLAPTSPPFCSPGVDLPNDTGRLYLRRGEVVFKLTSGQSVRVGRFSKTTPIDLEIDDSPTFVSLFLPPGDSDRAWVISAPRGSFITQCKGHHNR